MSSKIITISRQCGSGGHTIGKQIAQRLNIPFYDKKIIEVVAKRSGLAEETVQEEGEYQPMSLLYTIATTLSYEYSSGYDVTDKSHMVLPDQNFAFQTELIKELSKKGSCVIVGRCADYILRDLPNHLSVFLYGNLEDRKARVVEEHGIALKDAEKHILDRDKKRAKHYQHYTNQDWGRAENYDLCLNSSHFGIDRCTEIATECVN